MTTATVDTRPPTFVVAPAAQAPAAAQPRPGLVIMQEIARRLPDTLGMDASQAVLFNAQVQVLASLGRFIQIRASGLTLFQSSSRWADLGVAEHSARTTIFKHPPRKLLAPPATMEPFAQLYRAALHLRPTYGAHYPWFDAYYVTFKAERKLHELFSALEARWRQARAALVGELPAIRDWMQRHVRSAADEAYDSIRATSHALGLDREAFVERFVAHAEAAFPAPETVAQRLQLRLVDALPPDLQPPAEMIETVLGIKEVVQAEAREQQARAVQAAADAEGAQLQLEMLALRRDAERDLVGKMHARRLAHADALLRDEAAAQLGPTMAALQHAREVVNTAVSRALADYHADRRPSPQRIGALRKAVDLYELVSAGEVDLDAKVAALKAIVNEPAHNRRDEQMASALEQVAQLAAVETARAELDRHEDAFDIFVADV